MIDAVRVGLTALRTGSVPAPGDLLIVEPSDVSGVLLGIDDERRPHMLLELAPEADTSPIVGDSATLQIRERTLMLAGQAQRMLDVACLFQSVADVFEHFIAAVAERLGTAPADPVAALAEVLARWRTFLLPALAPVGRAKLAAVMGELLVLRDVVRMDPERRVDVWVGPSGGRHDFRRGACALEVKTTRSHTSREVTIHGEDQLEPPIGGPLHLHFIRLEEVPSGGETIASVVDDLLSAGAPVEPLFEGLTGAGIPIAELAATAEVAFEVRERLTFPVDDRMPRIVPRSFITGARPTGVLELNYMISLDHSMEWSLGKNAYSKLIGELAGAL